MKKHGLLDVQTYISPQALQQEKKDIFMNNWVFIGMETDIPQEGALYASILDEPIMVYFDSSGKLQAFYNLCRHRGTKLLLKEKKCIRCPYHNWTYKETGELLGVPQKATFSELDTKTHGLKAVHVGVWKGMLFAHLGEAPESLEEYFRGCEAWMEGMDFSHMQEYKSYRIKYEVEANWKIVIENFIDVYHLAHLHHTTLGMFDHSKIQTESINGHWCSFDPFTQKYAQKYGYKNGEGSLVHLLFPGLGINDNGDGTLSLFHIQAIDSKKTIIELRSFTPESITAGIFDSMTPKYTPKKEGNLLESGDFMLEDIAVMEALQEGMKSENFSTSPSSELEDSILQFHTHILKLCNYNF